MLVSILPRNEAELPTLKEHLLLCAVRNGRKIASTVLELGIVFAKTELVGHNSAAERKACLLKGWHG